MDNVTTIRIVPEAVICEEGDLVLLARISDTNQIAHICMGLTGFDRAAVARLLFVYSDLAQAATRLTKLAADHAIYDRIFYDRL